MKNIFRIICVIIVGIFVWYFLIRTPSTPNLSEPQSAPTTVQEGTTFKNDDYGITLSYPKEFVVYSSAQNDTLPWRYNSNLEGERLLTLSLPKSLQVNTNFSEATVAVGTSNTSEAITDCLVATNGEQLKEQKNGFSVFTLADAGAGNYYESTDYRRITPKGCLSVETVIHSTALANYPEDSGVKAFDRDYIQSLLDSVTDSIEIS